MQFGCNVDICFGILICVVFIDMIFRCYFDYCVVFINVEIVILTFELFIQDLFLWIEGAT